jgi:hypothetical protein
MKLTFSHVTTSGVDALDRYLADSGMTRTPGASGSVSGQDMDMSFALDLAAGKLTLDVARLPDHMPPEHIAYAVKTMLDSGKPFGVAGRIAEREGHRWRWG